MLAFVVVPLLVIFGGVRGRRYGMAAGGLVAMAAIWWYRTRPKEVVASGYTKFTERGETFECKNAIVDSEGELLECSSGVVAQVRQNTVLDQWQIPVGDWVEQTVFWVDNNLRATLEIIEWPFLRLLNVIVDDWLLGMSWLTVCIAIFALGWAMRGFQIGALSFIGLAICGLLGEDFWRETALTIGFIGVAVLLCVIVGIPIGVLCGRVDGAWKVVRPVMDAMQVVHSFVYMLPFIFFFGVGFVSATMVTMTFALPPLIRLTNLGIRQVPEDVVEASRAYGAPRVAGAHGRAGPVGSSRDHDRAQPDVAARHLHVGCGCDHGRGRPGPAAVPGHRQPRRRPGGVRRAWRSSWWRSCSTGSARPTPTRATLFSRIAKAWANRRTPEKLLEEAQVAGR